MTGLAVLHLTIRDVRAVVTHHKHQGLRAELGQQLTQTGVGLTVGALDHVLALCAGRGGEACVGRGLVQVPEAVLQAIRGGEHDGGEVRRQARVELALHQRARGVELGLLYVQHHLRHTRGHAGVAVRRPAQALDDVGVAAGRQRAGVAESYGEGVPGFGGRGEGGAHEHPHSLGDLSGVYAEHRVSVAGPGGEPRRPVPGLHNHRALIKRAADVQSVAFAAEGQGQLNPRDGDEVLPGQGVEDGVGEGGHGPAELRGGDLHHARPGSSLGLQGAGGDRTAGVIAAGQEQAGEVALVGAAQARQREPGEHLGPGHGVGRPRAGHVHHDGARVVRREDLPQRRHDAAAGVGDEPVGETVRLGELAGEDGRPHHRRGQRLRGDQLTMGAAVDQRLEVGQLPPGDHRVDHPKIGAVDAVDEGARPREAGRGHGRGEAAHRGAGDAELVQA